MTPWIRLAGALGFTAMALLSTAWTLPPIVEGLRSRTWPAVPAQLLNADFNSGPRSLRSPQGLRYRYRMADPAAGTHTTFEGTRFDSAWLNFGLLEGKVLAALKGGPHPSIHADPGDPSRSVLHPGLSAGALHGILITLLFLGPALGFWASFLVPWRGLRAEPAVLGFGVALPIVLMLPQAYGAWVAWRSELPPVWLPLIPGLALASLFASAALRPRAFGPALALTLVLALPIISGPFLFARRGSLALRYNPDNETLNAALSGGEEDLRSWALGRLQRDIPREGLGAFVPAMLEGLRKANGPGRRSLLATFRDWGPLAREATPALVAALDDEANSLLAFDALRTVSPEDPSALPVAIRLLDHPHVEVRRQALLLLRGFGPKAREALPRVVALASDPDKYVRAGALFALRMMSAPIEVALPAYRAALIDPFELGRAYGAEGLGSLGPAATSAVPELERCLKDPRSQVRQAAQGALNTIRRR